MGHPTDERRVLGIVGGTGPESTVDYYRSLVSTWRRRRPDGSYPRVAAMRDRDGIDAVILGGTELALILTEPTCAGVAVLNTAQIHVDAAVDWLLGG